MFLQVMHGVVCTATRQPWPHTRPGAQELRANIARPSTSHRRTKALVSEGERVPNDGATAVAGTYQVLGATFKRAAGFF